MNQEERNWMNQHCKPRQIRERVISAYVQGYLHLIAEDWKRNPIRGWK